MPGKKPQPEPLFTPEQLAEIKRMNEQAAKEAVAAREREIEQAKEPKPEPRPAHKPGHYETQPSSELKALLLEAFDAAAKEGLNGDNQMYHVFWILYGQSWKGGAGERIYSPRLTDQRTTKLLEAWRGCPLTELDWMERIAERSRIAQICRQLDLERKRPNYRAELLAEKIRLEEGIIEGSRWHRDARLPDRKVS